MSKSEESIIAVDLGGTNIRVGKVHGSEVTDRCSRGVPTTDSDEKVLKELISCHRNGV